MKTAALRRNFAREAFSAAAEETPIREKSAPLGASLYLQSRDLHFGSQVRVAVCARPVAAFELSALAQNNREKYREDFRFPTSCVARRYLKPMCCRHFRGFRSCADPANNRNGNRDNRERFSNNRESAARLSLYFCACPSERFFAVEGVLGGAQRAPIPAAPKTRAS